MKEMKILGVGTEEYEIMDSKARPVMNIEEMKNLDNLQAGNIIKTIGYHEANDGGCGTYLIRERLETDVEDDGSIHFIGDSLVAELIIENGRLNIKQFGAKGDNETDDTACFRKAFNYLRNALTKTLYIPIGIYILTDTVLDYGITGLNIIGEGRAIAEDSPVTELKRKADKTIFNFGGIMTLTGPEVSVYDVFIHNIKFRDYYDENRTIEYTDFPYITFHYAYHCTMENCYVGARNKAIDCKQFYDSRFINTDFSAGGNSESAMVTLHGGKNASESEIGWDSANCITFLACRFERYKGTAIETTVEEQPEVTNSTYNPCVARNVNNIYLQTCRFESPFLTSGNHLKFMETTTIKLDISMTVVDGQPNLQPIYFNKCQIVNGTIQTSYNRSSANPDITYSEFEQPILSLVNICQKFNLNLIVGTVFNNYKLPYFVNLENLYSTLRTINIDLIYDHKNKKLFNDTDGQIQNFNIYHQGRDVRYGKYENGYGSKVDSSENNEYFNNMVYDPSKDLYFYDNKYNNADRTGRLNDRYVSNEDATFHRHDCGNVFNGGFLITPDKYPTTKLTDLRSNGTTFRSIMYGATYPTEEITDTLFKIGDIIFNTNPTVGGYVGWVCTISGNPGTWKPFGQISE